MERLFTEGGERERDSRAAFRDSITNLNITKPNRTKPLHPFASPRPSIFLSQWHHPTGHSITPDTPLNWLCPRPVFRQLLLRRRNVGRHRRRRRRMHHLQELNSQGYVPRRRGIWHWRQLSRFLCKCVSISISISIFFLVQRFRLKADELRFLRDLCCTCLVEGCRYSAL
jgi:hypothetical protein